MGHRIDELPVITTPSDSDKVVVEHDNLTSQITLARLIAAERARLNLLESKLQVIGAGSFENSFSNTVDITTQADELSDSGTFYGTLSSSGHQTETGTPLSTFWYVRVQCYSAYYKVIDLWGVDDPQALHYTKWKKNNAWQSSWVLNPSRAEISLHNLSTSITKTITPTRSDNFEVYKDGHVVVVVLRNVSYDSSYASDTTIATGLPHAICATYAQCFSSTTSSNPILLALASGALQVGRYTAGTLIYGTLVYITAD